MKHLIVFLLSIPFCSFLFAQNKAVSQLSGKVTDAKTGEPLVGTSVIISDSRIGTTTDSAGYYLFRNIPQGHALLEVSHAGYRPLVEHVEVGAGTTEHNFTLASSFIENEGVTVTGAAGATSIRKAPVPITRVSKAELLATPSTNIIDALTRQPGVSQLSTGPAVSKPIIRGLGYNRLVTINDGVRQEGQQWGDEHGIEIDENSVSRVEILKGPAALIYGSDAIAGVINIITTAPPPTGAITGSILSSYQTNNRQRSLFGNVGGNNGRFSWNAWGDKTAAADYRNKYDGRVFNSKFNEANFGGYTGLNGTWGYSRVILSRFNQKLGVVEGDRDNNGHFLKALPGGAETAATEDDFNSTTPAIPYQHIRHTKLISDNSFRVSKSKLTLNLAVQRNQRQEFGNPDEPAEKSLYFDLKTVNYNAGYHLPEIKGWHTSIGVNGMAQSNRNKGVEVLIPEYNLFDLGAFVYSQRTTNKLTYSGGIRFDHRSLDSKAFAEGGTPKFTAFQKGFSNLSGSIGLSYAATANTTLKLNIAHGFRAPSVPELASNGAHEGTNRYEYGDPNLKSETTWQGDAGIELGGEHVQLNISAFYNHINDFIFYSKLQGMAGDSLVAVGTDLIPAFKFSQHTANLPGLEAALDIHPHPLDWLHWENTVSYVRGTFGEAIDGSKNVPFVPAARLRSELRAELFAKAKGVKGTSVHVEADHTFNQNQPFTGFDTETATPGYTLINAGISTTVLHKGKPLFSVYFLGNNLGDVAYQSHLSRLKYAAVNSVTGRQGVFNTGRNFTVKLAVPLAFAVK